MWCNPSGGSLGGNLRFSVQGFTRGRTEGMPLAWMLIQTRSNCELVAEAALKEPYRDCEVYFPRIVVRRAHAGKVDYVERPFIPRYAFVDDSRGYRVVRSCPGVSNIVAYGQGVASAFDEIKAREYNGLIRLPKALSDGTDDFHHNDFVRIKDDAHSMSGFRGMFDTHCSKTRVRILLEACGRMVPVDLDVSQIERVM